jgi:hypothetical protein
LPDLAVGAHRIAACLWATGRARRASGPETEQDRCLRAFDEYLASVRGATTATRRIYLRYARQFLRHYFGTGAPEWSTVTAVPGGRGGGATLPNAARDV